MITLRRVFREQWPIIAAITLVFFLVALAFDLKVQSTHMATARIAAERLTQDAVIIGLKPLYPTEQFKTTEARLVKLAESTEVQREALLRLAPEDRIPYFVGMRITGSNSSRVSVSIVDTDRKRAIRRTDALADVIVAHYSKQQLDRLDLFIDRLEEVRRTFTRGRDATLTSLIEQLPYDELAASLAIVRATARPARVVQRANVPDQPFFTRGRLGQPAVTIGFALALLVALLIDAVRRRPRDPLALAEAAELPLLAAVPPLGVKYLRAVPSAYGRAVTALEHLTEPSPRVVLVTSPLAGEGKSSAALGLARAAGAGGRRVIVVECDLRRPALAARIGGERGPGLLQVLADPGRVDDALRPLPGFANVHALTAGGISTSAAELIVSARFAELLDALVERADLVLLDAPPLLLTADAATLVARSDAFALCARIGRSAVDELAAARRALERLPSRPGGVIVHNVAGEARERGLVAPPPPPVPVREPPPVPVGAAR